MAIQDELIIEQIQIGPMQNFTYIIGSQTTREVVLIDPAWDVAGLLGHINERGYKLAGALLTHYHPDHCGGSFGKNKVQGVAELLAEDPVKIYVNKLEADGVKKVTGISDSDMVKVDSGDKLSVGDVEVEFLHTPGHTPGSQCFRIKQTLVSGDTLFINGCGRVDLPGSNSEDMFHSIQKLANLPDDTILLPGHNYSDVPNASMGDTKKVNAYMRINDLNSWKMMMGG
ncbi:MAG: MBL fold metallo-hydrolase [Pseudomonadales bacterium]|nr:MBL fold metallo-hydrolase [Pseudomonadales bacterium]